MKLLFSFVMIVLWCFGVIGGFGSAIYCRAWPSVVGMVAVAFMSWPVLKEYINVLVSYHGKK